MGQYMMHAAKLLFYIEALFGAAIVLFRAALIRPLRGLIRPVHVILVLAIPVLGLFGGNKNVLYAYLFVIPLMFAGNRRALACVYALILPLYPEIGEPYMIGSIYILTFSTFGALNLGTLIALSIARGQPQRATPVIDAALWLFFLIVVLILARGVPLNGTARLVFAATLNVATPFLVMARCIRTPRDAVDVTLFMTLGAFCNALVAIFETKRSWPLFQGFYQGLHVPMGMSATLSVRSGFLRAQGALDNPATLAVLMGFGIVACMALRSRFSRLGFWLVISALTLGMLASQSRGGWIATVVGVALFWLYERRTKALATLVALGVAGYAVVAILPTGGVIGQLVGRSGGAQMTAEYRSDLLSRGIEEVRKHPLRGQTADELEVSMNDMRQGEHIIDFVNTHLFVALKIGLLGLLAWLVVWGTMMFQLWGVRGRRATAGQEPTLGLPFAMIGISFTALTFTSTIDRMLPLVAIGFGMASAFLAIARQRAATMRSGGGPAPLGGVRAPLPGGERATA